jgi:hypothetical protein
MSGIFGGLLNLKKTESQPLDEEDVPQPEPAMENDDVELQQISLDTSDDELANTQPSETVVKDTTFNEAIDDLLESIFLKVKAKLSNLSIILDSKNQIVQILRIILESLENEILKGYDKKKYAILVLKKLVEESCMDKENKDICLVFIDSDIASNTIDFAIDIAKGKTQIKKKTIVKIIKKIINKTLTCFK